MKTDFPEGIERDFYSAIRSLYSAGWNPDEDIAKQQAVIDLFNKTDLKAHIAFFCKKTRIVDWGIEEATPLEHLIFAAAGFENYTITRFSENIRPLPLLHLLENVEFNPAMLSDIYQTLDSAVKRYNHHRFNGYEFISGNDGIEVLEKLKIKLTKILEEVKKVGPAEDTASAEGEPLVRRFKLGDNKSKAVSKESSAEDDVNTGLKRPFRKL